MALLVHLPLTGDLHNQGLANTEVTNNGATVDNNGKIGKCYSFDGYDDYISLDSPVLYSTIKGGSIPFSVSMWIYCADSTRGILFGDYGLTGAINFNVELTASQQLRFYWGGNDTVASTAIVPLNSWTHIALVYDGKTINFYVNGVLLYNRVIILDTKNKTAGSYYLGRDNRVGGTAFNGKINDLRIYDHALSQKEISNLAKALVLHYPLDNNGIGGKNLLVGTNNGIANWQWTMQVGDFTKTEETTLSGIKGCKFIRGSTTHSGWSVIYYGVVDESVFKPSTNYVLSVDIYTTVETSFTASVRQGNATNAFTFNSKTQSVIPNKWNHVVFNLTTVSTLPSSTDEVIYFQNMDSSTGVSYIFKNLKLEEGDKATPWCPNSSDALYTALGYDDGIEYDTSGYGNNGTKVGTLNYSTDSPRYLASTYFDGNTACIRTPYNAVAWKTNFTINLWFKKNELNGNKGYETLFGGPRGFEMDTRSGNSTTLSLYMASTRGGNAYSPFNLGEWYMVTMVNDGTNELYYVNGELSKTIEKKNMPSGNYFIGAWSSETQQNYKGLISDFRIYATALSAEEIQKLYTVSASIDSNGNAYSAAYVEG